MILFTVFDLNKDRINDFLYCLERNCENRFIKYIYIFFDKGKGYFDVKSDKIRVHHFKGRPTLEDFVEVACKRHLHEIIMLANADIYFDESLGKLECVDFSNLFVHLTRRELPGNPESDNWFGKKDCAADTWIFRAPLRVKLNVPIGTLWCDHIIPQLALRAGYRVVDPVLSVKSWHKHINRGSKSSEEIINEFLASKNVKTYQEYGELFGVKIPFSIKYSSIKDCKFLNNVAIL